MSEAIIKTRKKRATIVNGKIVMATNNSDTKSPSATPSNSGKTVPAKPKEATEFKETTSTQTKEHKKEQRRRAKEEVRTILDQLVETFPAVFSIKDRKPLKIGIRDDLLPWAEENEITPTKLNRAMKYYVNAVAYFEGTLKNNHRFDLGGNQAGQVTDNCREYARGKLKHVAKKKERFKQAKESQAELAKADGVKHGD